MLLANNLFVGSRILLLAVSGQSQAATRPISMESGTSASARYLQVLFLVVHLFVFDGTNAQGDAQDDNCMTPSLSPGVCMTIYNCKPIVDFLTALPKPISQQNRELLARYQCGLDVTTVKVCCPSGPSTFAVIEKPPPPPDVTSHPNLRLLPQNKCGAVDDGDRILNGNRTGTFEFPWMALISYRTDRGLDFRCGATLINDRYVLTAAHCISNLGKLSIAGVRLGEHDIQTSKDCETSAEGEMFCRDPVQDMQVEEVIPHPQYNVATTANDIGLLRLARKATISQDGSRPICLPITKDQHETKLTSVHVTGWGRTESAGKSDVLLKVAIPVMEQEKCRKEYEKQKPITYKHICAGGKNNQDSCAGDSGGPLQVIGLVERRAKYIQYGVVSFGPVPCGQLGRPDSFNRNVQDKQEVLLCDKNSSDLTELLINISRYKTATGPDQLFDLVVGPEKKKTSGGTFRPWQYYPALTTQKSEGNPGFIISGLLFPHFRQVLLSNKKGDKDGRCSVFRQSKANKAISNTPMSILMLSRPKYT